jgi:hypothetical protein
MCRQDGAAQVTHVKSFMGVGLRKLDHDSRSAVGTPTKTVPLLKDLVHHPAGVFSWGKIQVQIPPVRFDPGKTRRAAEKFDHACRQLLSTLGHIDPLASGFLDPASFGGGDRKERSGETPLTAEGDRSPHQRFKLGQPDLPAVGPDLRFNTLLLRFKHENPH